MVSIILLDHNHIDGTFSCATLHSILSQQHTTQLELILVSKGIHSLSGLIGSIGGSCHFEHKFVYAYTDNLAQMINLGIKACSGDIIGYADLNSIFYPEKFFIQLDRIKNDKPMWSFGGFSIKDKKLEYFIGEPYFGKFCNLNSDASLSENVINHFPNPSFINSRTVVFSRKMIEEVGEFDPELLYLYDYDMWLRMAYVDEPFLVMPPLILQQNIKKEIDDIEKKREIDRIAKKLTSYSIGRYKMSTTQP